MKIERRYPKRDISELHASDQQGARESIAALVSDDPIDMSGTLGDFQRNAWATSFERLHDGHCFLGLWDSDEGCFWPANAYCLDGKVYEGLAELVEVLPE